MCCVSLQSDEGVASGDRHAGELPGPPPRQPVELLVGRDRELAILSGTLSRVARGGSAICVEGVPGIGKTALLQQAAEFARAAGYVVLTASASAAEAEVPFGVVRQLFEPEFVLTAGLDGPELPAGLGDLVRQIIDPSLSRPMETTDELVMSHALYRLAVTMSARLPLFLGIDDLDQTDLPSLRCLVYLQRRLHRAAIVLVATTTVGRRATDQALIAEVLAGMRRLRLRPLELLDCAQLVDEAFFPTLVAPEFSNACHVASDGNPFLLHALLHALVDEGVPPEGRELGRIRRCEPPWLADRLLARLRAQDPTLATLIRVVAVLGAPDLDVAAAAAEMPVLVAAGAARTLIQLGILGTSIRLELRSAVIRRSVTQDVSPVERDAINARAADFLRSLHARPRRIARHLLETTSVSGDWVADVLLSTAKEAILSGSLEEGIALLCRTLRENLPDEVRDDALLVLAILEAGSDIERACEHLAAVHTCRDRAQRLQDILRAYVSTMRGVEAADRVAALAVAAWDRRCASSVTATEPHGGNAFEPICGSSFIPAVELCLVVLVLTFSDRLADALRCCTEIAGNVTGTPFVQAMADSLRAFVHLRAGDVAAAMSLAGDSLDRARQHGQEGWIISSIALPVFLEAAIERGEIKTARHAIERAKLTERMPEYWRYRFLRHSKAKLDAAQELWDVALEGYLECGHALSGFGIVNPAYGAWRSSAALLHEKFGQHDRAVELATEELAAAQRWGAPRALGIALRAAALVGTDQDRDRMLTESAAALERAGATLELGATLLAHGRWLGELGQHHTAAEHLRRARELAERCGATMLSGRVDNALRAASAAASRSVGIGDGAGLTPHQRRIAAMAAAGLTNRRIANELQVTSRAVELHLTKVYRKLGITSRNQLPMALERTEASVRT